MCIISARRGVHMEVALVPPNVGFYLRVSAAANGQHV